MSDNITSDDVKQAWEYVQKAVSGEPDLLGIVDDGEPHFRSRFRATIAHAIGVSSKTIGDWLDVDDSPIRNANPDTKKAKGLVLFHRRIARLKDPYWELAFVVSKLMKLENAQFAEMSGLDGTYTCYRKNSEGNGFITGDIIVTNHNGRGPWSHIHTSSQKSKKQQKETRYRHYGPVFLVKNRLYMLGVGMEDAAGKYIRPMIFKLPDVPKKNVLIGTLLTELDGSNRPIAALTALVSHEHDLHGTEELEKHLMELLTPEESMSGALYGDE